MQSDLSRRQYEYHHRGLTVLEGLVPDELVADWLALAEEARRGEETVRRESEDGARRHAIVTGETVSERMPGLWTLYRTLPWVVEPIVCRAIRTSPYLRSSVNVKFYERPGDVHDWHYDTNAVTALLYLETGGHPTVVETLAGDTVELVPPNGSLLLMQGRRCRHAVPPLPDGVRRVTVPLNLYHPDDVHRPEGFDRVVYGD